MLRGIKVIYSFREVSLSGLRRDQERHGLLSEATELQRNAKVYTGPPPMSSRSL